MKTINIAYWIITALFAAFMLFTAVPNIMMDNASVELITGLGYPKYFIPFIGVAKVIGSIAILIPSFKRIKEWAYAGLFFDLFSATFSIIAAGGLNWQIIFMILPIVFLFISHYLWHKKVSSAAQPLSLKYAS